MARGESDRGLRRLRLAGLEEDIPRLRIVALKRGADPILMVPAPATQVADGDQLVVIGERRSLEALAQLAQRAR